MEYINCNFCNNDNTEHLFVKKDKFSISNNDFKIVRCKNCGLIYINPRPEEAEIVRFYPDTYSWRETLKADSFFTQIIRRLEKVYRYQLLNYEVNKVVIYTTLKNGKVLDIGCGTGDRLKVFRRKGFDVYGVEVSQSARYARECLNLNVMEGNLFQAHYPDNFFDLVTVHNVIEHVHDPKGLLEETRRILKKNSFLVIQVPNTGSLQFKILKKRWAAFDVPRDLYYFNSAIISYLSEKQSFKVIKMDHYNHWMHPPTIVLSLFPSLDPQKAWQAEAGKRGFFLERLAWLLLTFILSPFTFLESLINKSAIITVYARRMD